MSGTLRQTRLARPRRAGVPHRAGGARAAILQATVQLMAEQGFDATSVEEIATVAGVAKGSVYYNFENKEAIRQAALADGFARLADAIAAAGVPVPGPPDGDVTGQHAGEIEHQLDLLVTALLGFVAEQPQRVKVMVAEVLRVDQGWRRPLADVRSRVMQAFAGVMQQAHPGEDVTIRSAAACGAVLVGGLEWMVFQPERPLDEVRRSVLAMLLGGL